MREGLEASFCGRVSVGYGCNTAGLCAVATLIDLCGVAPLDAWNGIRAARPIFSEGHVALLNARYPGNNFSCDAAPAWYGPQVEGDAEDDPEIDDEAPPPQKKRTHEDAADAAPAEAKPRNKRPKLRKAAAAPPPPPPPNDLRHGDLRTLDVHATAPDGTRSRIGGLSTTFEMCPPALEVRPDAYDKDLPKISALRVVWLHRRRRPGGPRGAAEILAG